ncbi:MAG: phosphoenolpyruvate carboxykinase (ATP), partial [bacterium]|nr:phosphoenolpyruvate carboxykinase (ATP) [bacterium]
MITMDWMKHPKARRNLSADALIRASLERGAGELAANGALAVKTGKYTGRSPGDRFIVRDALTEKSVDWGSVNQPFDSKKFDNLCRKVTEFLAGREVFVRDSFACADSRHRFSIRVVTQYAWHNLFAAQLFLRYGAAEKPAGESAMTILCAPDFKANPAEDGTNSECFVILNFEKKIILIGGTEYAGEIKKSIFSALNFLLPGHGDLTMHCSANVGPQNDVALFFGLSGTGKTTLSADPHRRLIGDDEHVWSDQGVFNIEGGCYAKCIKLSEKLEPQIWKALRRGAVLENVVIDPKTKIPDYDDGSLTENTRAAYPIEYIDNAVIPGVGGHPN